MTDIIILDPQAARSYLEETDRLRRSVDMARDNAGSLVRNCQIRYDRLRCTLSSRIDEKRRVLEEFQDHRSEDGQEDTARIHQAQAEYDAARQALVRLEQRWEQFYPAVRLHDQRLQSCHEQFHIQKRAADLELERYCGIIHQIRQTVNEEGAGSDTPSSPSAPGWCPKHHITAVSLDNGGSKHITMTIGGKELRVPCDKAGIARACRAAHKSGDEDMLRITNAMFEVESFRESLCLGTGHPNVPQLGGYHQDVKKQDPPGYESHHIPARSVQDRDAEWLPALSITEADHALTASYRGRQGKVYDSVFPGNSGKESYRETVIRNLAQGESGYLHAMKCELLDLKDTTGSKYDGAISAYLDAVQDMLCTRGIPGEKPVQKKEQTK